MDIKIITDTASFDSLKGQWDKLAATSDTYIYQTFEWNRTWWKHFGTDGNLFIILFYTDNRLVGIAPLFWDTFHFLGRKVYSCLRLLGSNVSQPKGEPLLGLIAYSDYLTFLVEPGYEEQVSRKFVDHFQANNLPYDEIIFEEIPEKDSVILQHMTSTLDESEGTFSIEDDSSCVNIALDTSWEGYLKTLSKKTRNKTRGYLRQIEDERRKVFNIDEPETLNQVSTAYETLVHVHQKQWNEQNFPGTFYEKRMYDFIKEISEIFFKKGWLQIKKLTPSDDEQACAGIYLVFKYKKRVYGMLSAMDYHSPLLSKGIGHTAMAVLLKEAIDNDYDVFDFMRGVQSYKLNKADTVTTNKRILIQHPGKKNNRRVRLVKKIISVQRRLRVEMIQCKLSFRNKNFVEGIKNYLSFISQRFNKKRASSS